MWRFARWLIGNDGRDWALAVVLMLASLAVLAGGGSGARVPEAVGVPLVILGTLPVAWRRRRPELVLALATIAYALYVALALPDGPAGVSALVGLFTVAAHRPREESRAALVLAAGLLLVALIVGDPLDIGSIVAAMALVVLAWSIGSQVRQRRLRSEDRIQRLLAEDRLSIARELHDVVAHGMSVMVVQAGAARTVLRSAPDSAEGAIKTVEETGRESLSEMRRILGVLRGTSEEGGDLAPQPGVDDIPALVEASAGAGVRAELSLDGTPRPLDTAVGLSAYRIAQGALTNVRRHAGPNASAEVRLRYLPGRTEVEVRDDGLGANGQIPGHGLAGMRERAESLGGEFEAGPGPQGGLLVHAVLPDEGEG